MKFHHIVRHDGGEYQHLRLDMVLLHAEWNENGYKEKRLLFGHIHSYDDDTMEYKFQTYDCKLLTFHSYQIKAVYEFEEGVLE